MIGEEFELTWSRISRHNSASGGFRSKMNVLPSFDDKIFASVRTDSPSSDPVRAFSHSLLYSAVIAFTKWNDGDRGLGEGHR